jgi:hypothetical protein
VKGREIAVDGESVQVFDYPSGETADGDAKRVSPDGSAVGTSKVSWLSTPHFFKKGDLIVLYVGGNRAVLDALRAALGPQFAGG